MTSPSGDIIKAFRNYDFYKAEVHQGRHKYDRFAKGYSIKKSPMGQQYCSIEFKDNYDTRIPFYERYYKMRKELSLSTLQDINTFLSKPKKPKNTKEMDVEEDEYDGYT